MEGQQVQQFGWWTILGSAAVGALVSSGITAIAQWRERKARREELLLNQAMELARRKHDAAAKYAAANPGRTFYVPDDIVMAEQYYKWLKHLMEQGELPGDSKIQRERPKGSESSRE